MPFDVDPEHARVLIVAAGEAGARIAGRLDKLFSAIVCFADPAPTEAVSRAMALADVVFIVTGLESESVVGRAAELAALARNSPCCRLAVVAIPKSSMCKS